MNPEDLKRLLQEVKNGKKDIQEALNQLKDFSFKDLGHTKIDNHRELRTGYPEVIFCSLVTVYCV